MEEVSTRIASLLLVLTVVVGCERKGTNVKLYKGPVADDDRYLASTFSQITCNELAKGLCAQFGEVDGQYTCCDGPNVCARIKCDELAGKSKKSEAPTAVEPPKPSDRYYAEIVGGAGSKTSHAIPSLGRVRHIKVQAEQGATLRCTWNDASGPTTIIVKAETGSSCNFVLAPDRLGIFARVEFVTGGGYSVVAD